MGRLRLKGVLYLYIALLTFLTLAPGSTFPEMPTWGLSWDKVVHFLLFAVLAFLLVLVYYPQPFLKNLLVIVTFCVIYGLLLETAQILIPGRFFSWQDQLANTLGAAVGGVIWGFKLR